VPQRSVIAQKIKGLNPLKGGLRFSAVILFLIQSVLLTYITTY